MGLPSEFEELGHQSHLQEKLDNVFADIQSKRVIVGCLAAGEPSYAAVGSNPEPLNASEWMFPTGCITKLFTAALIEREADAGRVILDDPVTPILDDVEGTEMLAGVTITHLLEHTHGLDDSACERAPLRADGVIDLENLLGQLAGSRIASPGDLYSYSNAGAWIAAGILEQLNGTPFEEQLRRNLFDPFAIKMQWHGSSLVPADRATICASMGGALALSASDMMRFLELQALRRPETWPAKAADRQQAEIVPLPGWNALEKGVCRGWKYHGEGWFGHNSTWPDASALVRVQPRRNIAIVVASRDHPAPVVAAKLFANVLPEYRNLSFPKPLPADAAAKLDLRPYIGQYRSAAQRLSVEARDTHDLRLIGPDIDSALIPASDDVFFTHPSRQGQFTFVQFLRREDENGFRYLWDGQRAFRSQRSYGVMDDSR